MTKIVAAEKPLRVLYLEAENVKRLKAVRIHPDRTLVRIEGRNGQGKSSVLDTISAALGGGEWNPDLPVRRGERKGRGRIVLGSDGKPEFVVERRWTAAGGTTLEVTTADGSPQRAPQAFLTALLGSGLAFDPLEFARMKPKEQAELLRRIAGLDFASLDAERERLFAERTVAGRLAREADARVGPCPTTKPLSMVAVNIDGLAAAHDRAVTNNRAMDEIESEIREAKSRSCQQSLARGQRIGEIEKQVAELQRRCVEIRAEQDAAMAEHAPRMEELGNRLSAMTRVEMGDLAAQIRQAQENNARIVGWRQWEKGRMDADAKLLAAEALGEGVAKIDEEKDRALRAAKFPLEGLSVNEFGPTLNGVPFSQASSAEQLRCAVAIGLSQKTRARIILCRDGSILDSASLDALHAIAEEFEAQVWIERVAESSSSGAVYIEDGEVVGAEAETETETEKEPEND